VIQSAIFKKSGTTNSLFNLFLFIGSSLHLNFIVVSRQLVKVSESFVILPQVVRSRFQLLPATLPPTQPPTAVPITPQVLPGHLHRLARIQLSINRAVHSSQQAPTFGIALGLLQLLQRYLGEITAFSFLGRWRGGGRRLRAWQGSLSHSAFFAACWLTCESCVLKGEGRKVSNNIKVRRPLFCVLVRVRVCVCVYVCVHCL